MLSFNSDDLFDEYGFFRAALSEAAFISVDKKQYQQSSAISLDFLTEGAYKKMTGLESFYLVLGRSASVEDIYNYINLSKKRNLLLLEGDEEFPDVMTGFVDAREIFYDFRRDDSGSSFDAYGNHLLRKYDRRIKEILESDAIRQLRAANTILSYAVERTSSILKNSIDLVKGVNFSREHDEKLNSDFISDSLIAWSFIEKGAKATYESALNDAGSSFQFGPKQYNTLINRAKEYYYMHCTASKQVRIILDHFN